MNDKLTLKTPIWSTKARELLQGNDWVDGMEFFRAVAKSIPPGVALRKAEIIRAATVKRRLGEGQERRIERSQNMLIAAGRRAIAQNMISTRRRKGFWELDPWPLPNDAWTKGGWRIRNLRSGYISFSVAVRELSINARLLHELIEEAPPVPLIRTGKTQRTSVINREHLPVLQERLEARWEAQALAKMRAGMETPKTQPWYTVTDLTARYGVATDTINHFHDEHPEVRILRQGRISRVLTEDLPDWETAFLAYMKQAHVRRVAAARKRTAAQRPPDPTFQDPQLAASASAYLAGDQGPEQMHDDMRRVFQELDAADAADAESETGTEEDLDEWDDAALAELVDEEPTPGNGP